MSCVIVLPPKGAPCATASIAAGTGRVRMLGIVDLGADPGAWTGGTRRRIHALCTMVRPRRSRLPLRATAALLERPSLDEGFDALSYVAIRGDGFLVLPWNDDDLR